MVHWLMGGLSRGRQPGSLNGLLRVEACSQAGAELLGLLRREKQRSLGCPLPVALAQPGAHDAPGGVARGQQHVADLVRGGVAEPN